MTVRRLDDGKPLLWLADIRPGGRNRPRRRKRFATKGETAAWELWQLEQLGVVLMCAPCGWISAFLYKEGL